MVGVRATKVVARAGEATKVVGRAGQAVTARATAAGGGRC